MQKTLVTLGAVALLVVALLLAATSTNVEAGWPMARWKRPTGFSEQGDRRYLMQKYMRKVVEDYREYDVATVPPDTPPKRKSRSYHFQYGPIYPDHHEHIVYGDKFWPEDHQLYY